MYPKGRIKPGYLQRKLTGIVGKYQSFDEEDCRHGNKLVDEERKKTATDKAEELSTLVVMSASGAISPIIYSPSLQISKEASAHPVNEKQMHLTSTEICVNGVIDSHSHQITKETLEDLKTQKLSSSVSESDFLIPKILIETETGYILCMVDCLDVGFIICVCFCCCTSLNLFCKKIITKIIW